MSDDLINIARLFVAASAISLTTSHVYFDLTTVLLRTLKCEAANQSGRAVASKFSTTVVGNLSLCFLSFSLLFLTVVLGSCGLPPSLLTK